MSSYTSRLKLYKADPSEGMSDPVNVNTDLIRNYDILDDNAPLRTRPNGVFPSDADSFPGGMLYHPNGNIYIRTAQDDWYPFKQKPSHVKKIGISGANVPNATDTYLSWGYTENKESMEFESGGAIRFKQTGLYYVTFGMNVSGSAGNYERFPFIMLSNASGGRIDRAAQNRTQGSLDYCTVNMLVRINSDRIGWKAQAVMWQNSGAPIVYSDSLAKFACSRVGGEFD